MSKRTDWREGKCFTSVWHCVVAQKGRWNVSKIVVAIQAKIGCNGSNCISKICYFSLRIYEKFRLFILYPYKYSLFLFCSRNKSPLQLSTFVLLWHSSVCMGMYVVTVCVLFLKPEKFTIYVIQCFLLLSNSHFKLSFSLCMNTHIA